MWLQYIHSISSLIPFHFCWTLNGIKTHKMTAYKKETEHVSRMWPSKIKSRNQRKIRHQIKSNLIHSTFSHLRSLSMAIWLLCCVCAIAQSTEHRAQRRKCMLNVLSFLLLVLALILFVVAWMRFFFNSVKCVQRPNERMNEWKTTPTQLFRNA